MFTTYQIATQEKPRLLLIEPNPERAKVITAALNESGYSVYPTMTAAAAKRVITMCTQVQERTNQLPISALFIGGRFEDPQDTRDLRDYIGRIGLLRLGELTVMTDQDKEYVQISDETAREGLTRFVRFDPQKPEHWPEQLLTLDI